MVRSDELFSLGHEQVVSVSLARSLARSLTHSLTISLTHTYIHTAPDRRWLSSPDSPTDVSLESSRQLERWENYFCRMLQTSDYDTLQDAHDCRFRVSHDGRENDDDDEDEYQVPLLKQTKLLL